MKNKLGSIFTYIAQIGVLAFGFAYFFKTSFMPYHGEAIGMTWDEVPYDFQRLIWTYMKAASGGWIALGLIFIYLQYKFNQNKEVWIARLILFGGFIFGAVSFHAALGLKLTTPANAPVMPVVIIFAFLLVGFYFNNKYAKSED